MPPSRWRFWLWQFAVTVSLVVWWGGLTFYAAIVVPLGIEQFGGVEQGLLTQRVTVRLNVAGTIVGICLLADALWRQLNGTDFTRKVAGTFHVPSAINRLTAHGMCLLLSVGRQSRNCRAVLASVLLGLQVWLWFLHARLSRWLEAVSSSLHSDESFYHEHRIYLWVTSAQWLIGLACLGIWCIRPPASSSADPPV